MVYSCGVREPYATSVTRELIGASEAVMTDMPYLHPDEVDPIANLEGYVRMTQGYPVEPAFAPTKLMWGDKRKAVPDFIVYCTVPIISERVKAIVEEYEPGAHQFLPLDLYHRKATAPFARHYWFVICKLIDTIDEKATTYQLEMSPWAEGVGFYDTTNRDGHLIHSRKKISGNSCWREKYSARWWMMSDQIIERFEVGNIVGLGKTRFEEVE